MLNVNNLIYKFIDSQNGEPIKIGVIGDVVIDEYYEVIVNRISPEMPVPVMLSVNNGIPSNVLPGGAANLAWQFKPFNTKITLFSCLDPDAVTKLKNFNFDIKWEDHGRKTAIKRRFYDKDYCLPRWDIENCDNYDDPQWQTARINLFKKIEKYIEIENPDIIILSDYNKGLFFGNFAQDVIELCNDLDTPTLVDPKKENLNQWKNCTIFKPNKHEANNFIAKHIPSGYHEDLLKYLNCEAMVITSGEEPIKTYLKNAPASTYKIEKKPNGHPLGYSGAGDCFASVFAVAYICNFNIRESSIIAHHASNVFVQRKYNYPITIQDLRRHIDPVGSKIFTNIDDLKEVLLQKNGKVVWSNGCYDILHQGHLTSLEEAKKQGDILIVGVDSDENVKRLKGDNRPINSLSDRIKSIACLQFVDYVISFDGSPLESIRKLSPHVLVKGSDYSVDKIIGHDIVKEVVLIPLIPDKSTTKIIEKINENYGVSNKCGTQKRGKE